LMPKTEKKESRVGGLKTIQRGGTTGNGGKNPSNLHEKGPRKKSDRCAQWGEVAVTRACNGGRRLKGDGVYTRCD